MSVFSARVQVGVDDAGTALVVWETTRSVRSESDHYGRLVSTGVWASLRPAGGVFGAPLALAGPQSDAGGTAEPRLAMSSNGHAIVAWNGPDGALASLRGPGGPLQQAQPVASRPFNVNSVAITDAGEALVAGTQSQLVVRPPNGSFGPPRTFAGVGSFGTPGTYAGGAPQPAFVAADARGDALFAYAAVGGFRIAQRPAGGTWDDTTQVAAPGSLRAASMTGSGEGVVTWAQSVAGPRPQTVLMAAIVTPRAAPVVQQITSPYGDGGFDGGGLDGGPSGDVAAAWNSRAADAPVGASLAEIFDARRVAQIAIRRPGGAFAAPITLTPDDGDPDGGDDADADVAVDGGGAVLATWVDHHPGQARLKAIWIDASGSSPMVLDATASPDAPPTTLPAPTTSRRSSTPAR